MKNQSARLFACVLALLVSASALAEDADERAGRCREAAIFPLHTWHKLDLCLTHHVVTKKAVLQVKRNLAKTYPKLEKEIGSNGQLSLSMKRTANGLPYDFRRRQNAKLLERMCEDSMISIAQYVEPEWQKQLACWR